MSRLLAANRHAHGPVEWTGRHPRDQHRCRCHSGLAGGVCEVFHDFHWLQLSLFATACTVPFLFPKSPCCLFLGVLDVSLL